MLSTPACLCSFVPNGMLHEAPQLHAVLTLTYKAGLHNLDLELFLPPSFLCSFVPTRILRSCMKHRYGCNIPIQTIGLQLYDVDGCDPETSPVQRVQWLAYGTGPGQVLLQGHRILIVDEVRVGGCYVTY
jgi:hypothetical protein